MHLKNSSQTIQVTINSLKSVKPINSIILNCKNVVKTKFPSTGSWYVAHHFSFTKKVLKRKTITLAVTLVYNLLFVG